MIVHYLSDHHPSWNRKDINNRTSYTSLRSHSDFDKDDRRVIIPGLPQASRHILCIIQGYIEIDIDDDSNIKELRQL